MDSDFSDQDLYALLNLSKEASEEEIKRAFKDLSLLFHPDKFSNSTDELLEKTALETYQSISYAYSVLSDREKRQIYDEFGQEGLGKMYGLSTAAVSPWQHNKILHLLHRQREKEAESKLQATSKAALSIDASALLEEGELPELHAMTLKQTVSCQVSPALSSTFEYDIGSTFGKGTGSFSSCLQYAASERRTLFCALGFGNDRFVNVSCTNRLFSRGFLQVGLNCPVKGGDLFPHLQLSAVYALSPKYSAVFSVVGGAFQRAIVLTLRNSNGKENATTSEFTVKVVNEKEFVLEGKSIHALSPSIGLYSKVKAYFSTVRGYSVFAGLQFPLGNVLSGTFGIESGSMLGVVMRLGIARSEHVSLSIPIILTHEFEPLIACLAAAIPLSVCYFAYRIGWKPLRKLLLHSTSSQAHSKASEEPKLSLLQVLAQKRVEQQEKINGLVVLSAVCGPRDEEFNQDNSIDVTVHLNAFIDAKSSKLALKTEPYALIGAWDPAPFSLKKTIVHFRCRGEVETKEFHQGELITLGGE